MNDNNLYYQYNLHYKMKHYIECIKYSNFNGIIIIYANYGMKHVIMFYT